MGERVCSVDGCEKKHEARGFCSKHYHADRYQRDGEPARARSKAWREAHPDYLKDYLAGYYAENREQLKERAQAWRIANPEQKRTNDASWSDRNRARKNAMDRVLWHADPERSRQRHARWYANNQHKAKEAWHRRRARKFAAGYERVDLKALLLEHGMICHICKGDIASRADLHFDHVIPLAKGGPHAASNIRPSHAKCNLSKGARILTN
jgi:5-methylcytosine-specific restriction endonuclease McrA